METAVTFREAVDTVDMPGQPRNFAQCQRDIVPVTDVLAQIGGKWTIFIVTALSHGPMRFSELRRQISGISQKMLTATLRDLEKDGFVSRKVTPRIPPRVDYELTEMGRELRVPLQAISAWAVANRGRVEAARDRYAALQEEALQNAW